MKQKHKEGTSLANMLIYPHAEVEIFMALTSDLERKFCISKQL